MNDVKLDTYSLEELFILYGKDEFWAFDEIFRRISPGLGRYLGRRLNSEDQVDEVSQQVFLRLHSYRHRYDPHHLGWQWIYVIARSEMIAYLKKQSKLSKEEEFFDWMSQTEALDSNTSQKDFLDQILMSLKESDQKILKNKFIEGKTYKEIAEQTGLSSVSLRKKVSRLVTDLKNKLKE